MTNDYQDQLIGDYNFSGGKDGVIHRDIFGVTIDIYEEQMIGGVDYAITAMGTDTYSGMVDLGLVIFDQNWNIVGLQYDNPLLGEDPFISSFRPPNLGVGQPGTFYVGVFDEVGTGGTYHLGVSASGVPYSFGGSLVDQMTYLQ